jgi:hypothetical protein
MYALEAPGLHSGKPRLLLFAPFEGVTLRNVLLSLTIAWRLRREESNEVDCHALEKIMRIRCVMAKAAATNTKDANHLK